VDHLPEQFVLRVKAGDQPLLGGWVKVVLHTGHKNDFPSLHGPTDEDGVVLVQAGDLRESAQRSRDLFLMDYGSIENDWTGAITVAPLTPEDLEVVIEAIDTWGPEQYPPGQRAALRAAAACFPDGWTGRLTVEVLNGPTSISTVERNEGH
jgi:hypothetical protein